MLHIGQEIIITNEFPDKTLWGTKAIITVIRKGSSFVCEAQLINSSSSCPLYRNEIKVLNKQLEFSFMQEE